jgi:hypothetical protein
MVELCRHLFADLRHADFVAYWKATSIALTGAFGVLGLLTEFRDSHTKRISAWGWISLFGILVSTVGGVAAQIKESHDNAKTSAENSTRALSILVNTSATVTSINRLMSSLTGATVDVKYSLDCVSRKVAPCGESSVQEENILARNGLSFHFFVDPIVAKRYTDGAWLTTPADLQWSLNRSETVDPTQGFGGGGFGGSLDVTIPDYATEPTYMHSSSSRITSLIDLPGVTLIVMGNANQLNDVPVSKVTIKIKDGRLQEAGPFEKIVIHPTGPYAVPPPPVIAYRYVFPR